MMQILQNNDLWYWVKLLYPEFKFVAGIAAFIYAVGKLGHKTVNWFTEIKTNHLHHIQLGLDEIGADIKQLGPELHKAVDRQTETVSKGIDGLRDDLRAVTTALMAQSAPVKHRVTVETIREEDEGNSRSH